MTYGKILSLSAAAGITAAGLFLVAPPASGKERPVVVTAPADILVRRISFADLNLASAAGERTLNRRVGEAVADLCLEATSGGLGIFTPFMMKCEKRAWSQARPQIGRAVQRAHDIASTGSSPIAAVAITIAIPE
jgi:UrcA family protein